MDAKKEIVGLVKSEYMRRLPFFIRSHAIGKTLEKIANEHPDLYNKFTDGTAADEDRDAMSKIINGIFEEKMKKHGFIE